MEQPITSLDFKIPVEFVREFELDPRIVIKHPWVIGIPAPELFVKPELLEKVRQAGFEMMLVPKEAMR
jgi:uncharacterized protein (DUF2344 family)